MCDVKMVPFQIDHAVELSKVLRDPTERDHPLTKEMAKGCLLGPCSSLFVDGKLVGSGGIMVLWPGVGHAWFMIDPELALKYKKTVYVETVRFLRDNIQKLNLCRLQANCRADIPSFPRFLSHLGFRREALMRKYGRDGSDQYLYALVKEG